MDLQIRDVRPDDAQALVDIVNPIIEAGDYTVLDGPLTAEVERAFIEGFCQLGIFHVAEDRQRGTVVGFQTLEPFADYSRAFDHVAIVATYVDLSLRCRGAGKRLAEATFEAARGRGFEKIFTYVLANNVDSLKFYSRLGFRVVGTAEKQAKIGGLYVDEVIIEKQL